MSDPKSDELLIIEKHKAALRKGFSYWPSLEQGKMPALGDARWSADLIYSTWYQTEHGDVPTNGLEYRKGESGGGFDCLEFQYLPEKQWLKRTPNLSISLNKRTFDRKIDIPVPFYGAGMSYGSISENIHLAKAMAAKKMHIFSSTGEGGISPLSFTLQRPCVHTDGHWHVRCA